MSADPAPAKADDSGLLPSTAARLMFGLAFALLAGWVDAVGFIYMGQFYLSFMSGNTTQLGVALAGLHQQQILRGASVILSFFVGAFSGSLLSDASGKFRMTALMLTELALFGLAISLTNMRPGFHALLPIAVAMGMQNALRQMIGHAAIGRSFVTGALFSAGQSLARALTGAAPKAEWLFFLSSWIGFLLGATGGALVLGRFGLLPNLYGVAAALAFLAFLTGIIALDSRGDQTGSG